MPSLFIYEQVQSMEVFPRTAGQFPAHRLWASLDTGTCSVGNASGSVCPLSSQETSGFLISRGREKNGLAMPPALERCFQSLSHTRDPPHQLVQDPPFRSSGICPLTLMSTSTSAIPLLFYPLFLVSCSPRSPWLLFFS